MEGLLLFGFQLGDAASCLVLDRCLVHSNPLINVTSVSLGPPAVLGVTSPQGRRGALSGGEEQGGKEVQVTHRPLVPGSGKDGLIAPPPFLPSLAHLLSHWQSSGSEDSSGSNEVSSGGALPSGMSQETAGLGEGNPDSTGVRMKEGDGRGHPGQQPAHPPPWSPGPGQLSAHRRCQIHMD